MIALRDRIGPFRLTCFETLLRAADARGSGQSALEQTLIAVMRPNPNQSVKSPFTIASAR